MGFVTAIDHVGLAVRDLDRAIAFYQDAFGMELVHEEVNEEQGVREAMMAVGDSGSCVQLLAPLSDESPIGKFLARSGEGIQQVAYRVSDIEVAADELRANSKLTPGQYRDIFRHAHGRYGSTLDYARQTLNSLHAHGVNDLQLSRLLHYADE